MKKEKLSKDSALCLLSAVLIVGSFAFERMIEYFVTPAKTLGIALAMVYTVFLAVVTLILMRSKNTVLALLVALLGYKMMPVSISFIGSVSADASMLYYIVQKAAVVIFVCLIFKLYQEQEKPREIKPLPILAIMFAVPFFNEIGTRFSYYFHLKTGSMLLGFFAQTGLYVAASLIILSIAYVSGCSSMRFAAFFEFAALGINILKTAVHIALGVINGVHVSKSRYLWLFAYVFLVVCFFAAMKLRQKKETQ